VDRAAGLATAAAEARAAGGAALAVTADAGDEAAVAGAVGGCVAECASYVNGQAIAVDGVLSSTHPFTGSRR
jgi:hypothetical protein